MQPAIAMFDTHTFVKRLKAVGFTEEQSEVFAEEGTKLIEGQLATKLDIAELKRDMKGMETGLKRDMREMETNLKLDIELVRRDTREMETNLKRDMGEMETRLESRLIKWVTGLLFVQTGLVIGAFFAIVRLIVP